MADNVQFQAATPATPPATLLVATDDVGGAHYQRVKLDVGGDGVSTPVTSVASETTLVANGVLSGAVTEVAPATDTASSGLNGRLQRIAQRLTSLIALLPTALGANGGLKVEGVAGGVAQPVTPSSASSAALANIASSATSVTLQASNAARRGLLIFNDSTQILFVKFGAAASATSYTVQIAAGGYYEMPAPIYTGTVDGIWSSANGNARMTELA